jgi:hypothetical protein
MVKVGFTLMIQKQSIVEVEEPTVTKSKKKNVADSEFNKEHAYWFFLREGDCSL